MERVTLEKWLARNVFGEPIEVLHETVFVRNFLSTRVILLAYMPYVIVIPWVVRMYVEIIHEL